MNDLGIALGWTSVRVTLVLLPALLLHALAARRGPAAGSWVAAWGLGLAVALGLATVLPGDFDRKTATTPVTPSGPTSPRPARRPAAVAAAVPVAAEPGRRGVDPATMTFDRSWSWPIAGFRVAWGRFEGRAVAPTARWRRWGSALAIAMLIGTGLGLGRLLLGVWAVHLCRRRGRPVDDPALSLLLDEIKRAMGCRRRVEVRAVTDLTTPAAAGWLCPALLLPDDWRTWDDDERRAVLAHELAHVHRGDYATGLLARVALAVHFYHPFVLWLAARLQLEQELAADALGARFAGGRACYLHALSRLALRQDGRSPSWPARAFLPARGTLIRRIAMLRDESQLLERPWSGWRRLGAASLLLSLAVAAALLRGPAFGADEDAPGGKAKGATSAPRPSEAAPRPQDPFPNRAFADVITAVEQAPPGRLMTTGTMPDGLFALGELKNDSDEIVTRRGVEPFDLSFIPDDVMGFVAFRPALTFHREDLKRFVAPLNAGIVSVLKGLGVSEEPAKCPLRIEAIEQVTCALTFDLREKDQEPEVLVGFACAMIRTTDPFDWRKQIQAWWPDLTEVRESGKVYYRSTKLSRVIGPDCSVYFPDDRTVVIGAEGVIRSEIRRGDKPGPAWARAGDEDWERASRSLLAVAVDNRDGRWTRAFKKSDAEQFKLPSLVEHVDRWIFRYDDTDDIDFRCVGNCPDEDAAEATVRAVGAFFEMCRRLAGQPGPAEPAVEAEEAEAEGAERAFLDALDALTKCRATREGRRVVLRSDGLGKLSGLIQLFAEGVD